jgi:hypothetical protein
VELHITRWKRYGHDRLYANLPDGEAVAWADAGTGDITILRNEHRREAIQALTEHMLKLRHPARRPEAAPAHTPPLPPQLPPLSPESDLAARRPGEALRAKLAEVDEGLWRRWTARLLRRRLESDSWRAGLDGEKRVGAELNRLARHGWRVLHSVPLSERADIDHLLMGPGGVFTINTKHHRGHAVWVGDEAVKVNNGDPVPYLRKSRAEAERAEKVLRRHCGFPVRVEPILVFVGVKDLSVVPTQQDVHIYQERHVSALAPLTGVLTPDQVDRVYTVARNRHAWAGA